MLVIAVSTPALTAASEMQPLMTHPWSMSGNSCFVGTLAGVGIHVVPGPQNGRWLFEGVHHGFLVAAKDGLFENRGRMTADSAIEIDVAGGARLAHQPGSKAKTHDAEFLVRFLLLQKGRGGLDAGPQCFVSVRMEPGDAAVQSNLQKSPSSGPTMALS